MLRVRAVFVRVSCLLLGTTVGHPLRLHPTHNPHALQSLLTPTTNTHTTPKQQAKWMRGQLAVQDVTTFAEAPIHSALAREAARQALLDAGRLDEAAALQWAPALVAFPHPNVGGIAVEAYHVGPCLFVAAMLCVTLQLVAIATEKDAGLRQAMRTMGLMDSSYWLSWLLFDLALAAVWSLVALAAGHALRMPVFVRNDPRLLLALLFALSAALCALAYALSALARRPTAAAYAALVALVVGWVFQAMVNRGVPYAPFFFEAASARALRGRRAFMAFCNLLPWTPFTKATIDLVSAAAASGAPGLRWRERDGYCAPNAAALPPGAAPGGDGARYYDASCLLSVGGALRLLACHFFGYLLLALWLDNVVPNELGQRRGLLYFLAPSYWRPGGRAAAAGGGGGGGTKGARWSAGRARLASDDGGCDCAGGNGGGSARHWQADRLARLACEAAAARAASPDHCAADQDDDADDDVAREAARVKANLEALAGGGRPARDQQRPRKAAWLPKHSGGGDDVDGDDRRRDADTSTPAAPDGIKGHGCNGVCAVDATATAAAPARPPPLLQVFGLRKRFEPSAWSRAARAALRALTCGRRGGGGGGGAKDAAGAGFTAVKDSWFEIEEDSVFCLLGPNGAGKTTTINCLTGALAPSGGDALACGALLFAPGGVERARATMGVCPQFDVLWGQLTGLEQLVIFGLVKGVPLRAARAHARDLLARARLARAKDVRSASYSGGMRRRLSVAAALLGDPKLVFLDEPTTGLVRCCLFVFVLFVCALRLPSSCPGCCVPRHSTPTLSSSSSSN